MRRRRRRRRRRPFDVMNARRRWRKQMRARRKKGGRKEVQAEEEEEWDNDFRRSPTGQFCSSRQVLSKECVPVEETRGNEMQAMRCLERAAERFQAQRYEDLERAV
jgi:hypothetical protein